MLEDFLKNLGIDDPYPDGRKHNPEFDRFASNIATYRKGLQLSSVLRHYDPGEYDLNDILSYKVPMFEHIFEAVRDHRDEHSRDVKQDVVAVVHPVHSFYFVPDKMADGFRFQAQKYLGNLIHLFQDKKDDISVVLIEGIHHYAAFSSILLEHGLVDDVIYTNYNSGFVHKDEDDTVLLNKNIVLAGGANKGCLTGTFQYINRKNGINDTYAIPELVYDNPENGRFFGKGTIYGDLIVDPINKGNYKLIELPFDRQLPLKNFCK